MHSKRKTGTITQQGANAFVSVYSVKIELLQKPHCVLAGKNAFLENWLSSHQNQTSERLIKMGGGSYIWNVMAGFLISIVLLYIKNRGKLSSLHILRATNSWKGWNSK